MTSSTTKSEFYNPWSEHSREDIDLVNKLEDTEQKRRIADTLGEQQRRYVSNQVAEVVTTNLRPSWFQQGSTYVFRILKMAKGAGNDLLRSSQVRQMSAKLQVVGQKGIATASDMKHKVEEVGLRAQETSKMKLHDTLESASDVAHHGLEKVQEITQKLKDASLKFFVLEEENERQWRLNSELEAYAILNALAVSNILKETAPALYRPAFEPNRKYSTKLIEDYERTRRSLHDAADHTAINNAKSIARLITLKNTTVSAPIPAAPLQKAEVIAAPLPKKGLSAAQ